LDKFSTVLQEEGRIIRELREQYQCNQHNSSCFIDDGRHIKLTAMHFQCWAKEIVMFLLILHQYQKKNQIFTFIYF
jgi:hypothetical protein